MDVRLNSLNKDALHPFVESITYFLAESARRATHPAFVSEYLSRSSTKRYWESIRQMKEIAQQAIDTRRSSPKDKPDLLNSMLFDFDLKTGKTISEISVVQNIVTFLGAGKYKVMF